MSKGKSGYSRPIRSRIISIIAIVLLVAGFSIYFFPTVSNWLYQGSAERTIKKFNQIVQATENQSALDELYAAMQAYNQKIFENGQSGLADAFSYEAPSFDLTKYGFLENVIGYIEIPAINVRLPIYLGATVDNMHKGAAHLSQTSLPIGGVNTNSVIAGHRSMIKAAMFRNIDKLKAGDKVYIHNFRETLTYEVSHTQIIFPNQIDQVLIQPGRDMVTLFSCHPYAKEYQRYVVYCTRVG